MQLDLSENLKTVHARIDLDHSEHIWADADLKLYNGGILSIVKVKEQACIESSWVSVWSSEYLRAFSDWETTVAIMCQALH